MNSNDNFREFHRYLVGSSYNNISGRHAEPELKFYLPPVERPFVPQYEIERVARQIEGISRNLSVVSGGAE